MADAKISALTGATTPLAGTEVLPIVQGGATVKVSVVNLTAGRNVSMLNNTVTGVLSLAQDTWHISGDAKERLYYVQNDFTIFKSPTTWQWRDATNGTRAELSATGDLSLYTGNLVIGTSGKGVTLPGGITWTSGSGSPEGVVTAPVGSLYSRSDGGLLTSLYVKESGSGNTGWIGK
jgi:hypothetical protein